MNTFLTTKIATEVSQRYLEAKALEAKGFEAFELEAHHKEARMPTRWEVAKGQYNLWELDIVKGQPVVKKVTSGSLPVLWRWATSKGYEFRRDTTIAGGYFKAPHDGPSYMPYPVELGQYKP